MKRIAFILSGLLVAGLAAAHGHGGRHLRALDTNQDQMLRLSEVLAARDARFIKLDTNGDKALSARELNVNIRNEERAQKRFERLDLDKDGFVNAREWSESTAQLFARVDSNADNQLTREEFRAIRQKRLERRLERS